MLFRSGVWSYRTDRGYVEVSQLYPGLGYWIKVGREVDAQPAHGYLSLVAPTTPKVADFDELAAKENSLAKCSKVTLNDNAQREVSLYLTNDKEFDYTYYELPPLPPNGFFDARFQNGCNVDNSKYAVLTLQDAVYPLNLNISNSNAEYVILDAINGEILGTIDNGKSNVIINGTKGDAIIIAQAEQLDKDFFFNVYPNPVENTSTLNYYVPENSQVSIKLYDVVGNLVSTIVNEYQNAGSQVAYLNANGLAGGRYIVKIVAGQFNSIQTITVIK